MLNGTVGSDSPEIHSSAGSEPLLYEYSSRLAAAAANSTCLPKHFNAYQHSQLPTLLLQASSSSSGAHNGQHLLPLLSSASAYATDSSLSQNSVLSDHFSVHCTAPEGDTLLTPEPDDLLETCSIYPSQLPPSNQQQHLLSSKHTYPGSGQSLGYCSPLGTGQYCASQPSSNAYYHHHSYTHPHPHPPPPPPPTVISEHAPSAVGGGSNPSSKAPSLLYLAHQRQQGQSNGNYISNQQSHHLAYTASQSTSPPVLPPPPLSYHLPNTSTSASCFAYPDQYYRNPQQQSYSMQQSQQQANYQPQPNLVTIYNQSTGTTRSFCTTLPNGGNGALNSNGAALSNKPLHPHHHHHHHLYHYHLPPDHPANIKLLSNTTINATPLLQSGKAPLYATLQQVGKVGRVEASVGSTQGKQSRGAPLGNGAVCPVYNNGNGDGYPGQQRHLNGNCIANHNEALRRGSLAGLVGEPNQRNQTATSSSALSATTVLESQQQLQRDQITGVQLANTSQSQQTRVQTTVGTSHNHNYSTNQNSSQAEMMAAEMTRNKQAAEQEAQLRELKGYEASYQYQPRSVFLDGTAGGGGEAVAPGASGTGNPADLLPPLINTNANLMLPGADKRSCSQWRMTLFVFYWIIWIVFLIGVVIIVAANARTASGSFPGQK